MDNYEDMIEDIYPDLNSDKNMSISKDMPIMDIIKLISPGTKIRISLDEILRADLGALIVLGDNMVLESIIRGGIKLDCEMNPTTLFEIAKMDGAIVLSNDLNKIYYANVHLTPDRNIETKETGTRHRSGEQTAIQTGLPVIAISKRRKMISLYYNKEHYVLQDLPYLTTKADHFLRTIANYRSQINSLLNELTYYELNNNSTYEDAIKVIQKIIYLERSKIGLENIIIELGEESGHIKYSLYEYTQGIRNELTLLILDYTKNKDVETIISKLLDGELYDKYGVAKALGINIDKLDNLCDVKGYRLLSRIPKLSKSNIEKIISVEKTLFNIISANKKDLAESCNISEKQADLVLEQLNKITDTITNKIYKI